MRTLTCLGLWIVGSGNKQRQNSEEMQQGGSWCSIVRDGKGGLSEIKAVSKSSNFISQQKEEPWCMKQHLEEMRWNSGFFLEGSHNIFYTACTAEPNYIL